MMMEESPIVHKSEAIRGHSRRWVAHICCMGSHQVVVSDQRAQEVRVRSLVRFDTARGHQLKDSARSV